MLEEVMDMVLLPVIILINDFLSHNYICLFFIQHRSQHQQASIMKVSFVLYALIGSPVVGQKSSKTYSPVVGGVSSKSAKGTKSNKASKTTPAPTSTPPLFTPYHAKFVGTGSCLDIDGRSFSKVVAQLPNGSNHEQCWGWCQQGAGPNTGHLGFEITKGAMCACLFDYGKLPNPLPEFKNPAEDFTISNEGDGLISGLGSDPDTECWKITLDDAEFISFSPTSPMPTKAPVSHSPVTLKPTSHSPVTLNPSSHSPSTMHPTSHTDSPTTLAPSSHQPTSAAPVTNPPSSHSPSSLHPSSHVPTTLNPTSHAPVQITSQPSTHSPTTHSPSSHSPSTMRPTSHSPSSLQPTSHVPTTLNPTSHAPVASTLAPTSHSPSSLQPTSHSPSSVSPTSPAPTAGNTDPKCSTVTCGAGQTCTGGVCHGAGSVRFTLSWTGTCKSTLQFKCSFYEQVQDLIVYLFYPVP